MGQVNLGNYKNLYLQTAKEYLDKMSVSLDQLSNDVSSQEALSNLHIASHSLKSQSQAMNYQNVADICLNIEKMSDDVLKGNTRLNIQTISSMKESVRKLAEILRFAQDDIGKKI